MKKILTISLAFLLGGATFAQVDASEKALRTEVKGSTDSTKSWSKGGVFNLGFGQTSLHNWAAGGLNSYSFNGLVSLYANRTKGKISWDNTLDLEYGAINQFSPGAADSVKKWLKNSDRLEFNSKIGMKANKDWYYTALLNFRSQMTPGYDATQSSVISDITSPAYTTIAIGMDYKPNANFSLFLSPIAYRMLYVSRNNLRKTYGFTDEDILEDKHRVNEFGAYLKAKYKKDKPFGLDNVAFQTDLALFSNYLKNPQNVDVYWNTLISLKVNKYITANIGTNLIYDHDITIQTREEIKDDSGNATGLFKAGPRVQFKEALTVGFSYKF